MGSPWEFAITQTMQRHGGSNRLLPKAAQPKAVQPKAVPVQPVDGANADTAPQSGNEPSIVPDGR
jgi:hypothetical protein